MKKVKRPNGLLYFFAYIFIYPLLKLFFRLKVDRSDYSSPDGPFLVVSNHASYIDFLLAMLTIYPRRLNAVAAQKFFLYRPLDKLLPIMGAIPKNLFDPDIRPIKRIITVLKRGGGILLFPEGRCSVDGAYAGMHVSTGKLVKSLAVPVISCHIEGGFICMPFWRKGFRLGRIRVTLARLFSGEEAKTMSADEINDAIDARLSGKDTPPGKPLCTLREKNLTEGLPNILYWCPACGREFTYVSEGNSIRCSACGNTAKMDRFARLTAAPGSVAPGNVHAWFREVVRYEMQKLSDDMEPISFFVTVRIPGENAGDGMKRCGGGIMSIDPEGWRFEGELSGEQTSLFFPVDTVPAVPFDSEDDFQIYAHGNFYMFTPEDARKCEKYATIGECAYWRFASRNQMTPGHDSGFIAAQSAER